MAPSIVLLIVVGAWLVGSAPGVSVRSVHVDPGTRSTNGSTAPCYQRLTGGGASAWVDILRGTTGCFAKEIQEAADRYGVDPRLVQVVVEVESGFDPWAVSRKGAKGLMQLMPQTASLLGIRDVFNPRQNIHGGVRHLRGLIFRYGGNLPLALAAYHAGHLAVNRYRGIPPYPETQQYVERIFSLYRESLKDRRPHHLTLTIATPMPSPVSDEGPVMAAAGGAREDEAICGAALRGSNRA